MPVSCQVHVELMPDFCGGRYVTGTEWVTGSSDGSVALWSQLKKKPAVVVRGAHPAECGDGCVAGVEAGWVQSVAACRGSDLVVRFPLTLGNC